MLAVVALAIFLLSANIGNSHVMLPTLAQSFQSDVLHVAWVSIVFLLCMGALQPLCGMLGDHWGYRNMLIVGSLIFVVGSLLCARAPSIDLLIAFRILLGIGAAMLLAMGPSIISGMLPTSLRGRGMSILELAMAVGTAAGAASAGLIIANIGWRILFYINIPIAILLAVAAYKAIPRAQKYYRAEGFDFLGSITLIAGLVLLLVGFNRSPAWGWLSPASLGSFGASAILLAAFVIIERRSSHPLIDMTLLHRRNLILGNIGLLLTILVTNGALFVAPFYLETTRGLSPTMVGVVFIFPTLLLALTSPLSGYIADKRGPRMMSILGALLIIATGIFMSFFNAATSLIYIIGSASLLGAAVGVYAPPTSSSVMADAPPNRLGMASGIMMLFRSLGGVIGIAIFSVVYASAASDTAPIDASPGIRNSMIVAITCGVVMTTLALFLKKNRPTKAPKP